MLIEIGVLSVLIEIGVIFGEIISKTYSVDRNESSISVDKYPRYIRVDIMEFYSEK
jgi:hypothetical protein